MFSCEFCEISKNTFFTEHLWVTASILIIIVIIIGVIIIFYLFELFEVIQTNWFPCSKKLIQEKLWSTYSLNAKKFFGINFQLLVQSSRHFHVKLVLEVHI